MQTSNLFACELMGTDLNTTCCCDEVLNAGCSVGGECYTSDNGFMSGCCENQIKIDIGLQDIGVTGSHHAKQVLALDAPQPPPVILIVYQTTLSTQHYSNKTALNYFTPSIASIGTDTYFKTLRFRI